jgi:Predicted enzyme related to lactoylglutathione lyase
MPNPQGSFVWHELMTPNPDAAVGFYSTVLGWGTQIWQGPEPYTMFANGDVTLGGIWPLDADQQADGATPQWMPYVGVRDVDATAAEAARLGATVLKQPQDIPDTGQFAVLRDPQGAIFAIFAPQNHAGAQEAAQEDAAPQQGEFSWHELTTTDHAAAFDFYSRIFGWEKTESFDMGPMGVYQMYGQAGSTYGGMFNKTPEMPVSPNWLCYVRVDDVKRAAEAVKRGGGTVTNGPMEVPGGSWIAQCVDPQGAPFAVHQLKK